MNPAVAFLAGDRLPEGIWSGAGCRHRLGEALDRLGVRSVMAVVSGSLLGATDLDPVLREAAGARLVDIVTVGQVGAAEAAIDVFADYARNLQVDCVLSAGGGAAHDIAKAVALTARAESGIAAFLGGTPPGVSPLPIVAMPTTFSAAEMVPGGAVIRADGGKAIFGHPQVRPRFVFLDGDLIATTPRATLAMSGCNAVHHCTEALYSLGHHPVSDAWALFALERLMRLLPCLAPGAPAPPVGVYQELLEAASISGLAYPISGLGVGHSICHSVAGHWPITHGAANAVILRQSALFNRPSAEDRFALAARAIGETDLMPALDRLCAILRTPATLREIGLPQGQFELIAADVVADPISRTNPRPVDRAGVMQILEAAW